MILMGKSSMHPAVPQLICGYHQEPNHQGLEDKIIRPEIAVFPFAADVCCRKRLGGLLRY